MFGGKTIKAKWRLIGKEVSAKGCGSAYDYTLHSLVHYLKVIDSILACVPQRDQITLPDEISETHPTNSKRKGAWFMSDMLCNYADCPLSRAIPMKDRYQQ